MYIVNDLFYESISIYQVFRNKNTYKRGSMTSFTDLHLELEIKAKDFRENPTEANGNKIIEEIVRLIKMNASVLIDGVQSDVNKDVTVPSGYYAKDYRFYIHIFSSKLAFDASTTPNLRISFNTLSSFFRSHVFKIIYCA